MESSSSGLSMFVNKGAPDNRKEEKVMNYLVAKLSFSQL